MPRKKAPTTTAPQPRVVTAEVLATTPTCAELPVRVRGLQWPDGTPMELTLRALTFRERRAVNRAAAKAGEGGAIDEDIWAIETLMYGLVAPKLTPAQIEVLWDLNADIIDELVSTIVGLGRQPARAVAAELARLAGLPIPPAPAPAAPHPDRQ